METPEVPFRRVPNEGKCEGFIRRIVIQIKYWHFNHIIITIFGYFFKIIFYYYMGSIGKSSLKE